MNLNDFSLLPCEIHCRLKGLTLRFLHRANPARRGSGQRSLPAISSLNTTALDPILPAGLPLSGFIHYAIRRGAKIGKLDSCPPGKKPARLR